MLKLKIVSCVIMFLMSSSVYAQDGKQVLLSAWYEALSPVNRDVISDLLAQEATIELKDYEIVQSKPEFIDALDSWEDAIDGGSIRYKVNDQADGEVITAIVCYTFSSNELMTEEIFTFSDEKILNSVQVTIAEDCAEF